MWRLSWIIWVSLIWSQGPYDERSVHKRRIWGRYDYGRMVKVMPWCWLLTWKKGPLGKECGRLLEAEKSKNCGPVDILILAQWDHCHLHIYSFVQAGNPGYLSTYYTNHGKPEEDTQPSFCLNKPLYHFNFPKYRTSCKVSSWASLKGRRQNYPLLSDSFSK